MKTIIVCIQCLIFFMTSFVKCQDNYEIQVYGSETQIPGDVMLELHNNYTVDGSSTSVDDVLPTKSAFHETMELTVGVTSCFEVGGYLFTSARSGYGLQWVGDHIRPRIRAPESWGLPVGLSLSGEIGYQRREYSTDTWTVELRPIVDKQLNRWYFSLNPAMDFSLKGLNQHRGLEFSPNLKAGFSVTDVVVLGVEYYGSLGPLSKFDPASDQLHQIFPSIDLNISPEWEFNSGVGFGLTPATDHLIAKIILGRRFGN
ncbi:MAG: hypothetical protein ACHQQQ_02800 [Bacteroidota bacterium]